jgi:glycine/D-amino acid oxidase-like deaminating enzyme
MVKSEVLCGTVTGIATESGRVVGVNLEGGELVPATVVVIALGPWTGRTSGWIPGGLRLPVTGDPAHSIVIRPEASITPHALFTKYQKDSKTTDPEVGEAVNVRYRVVVIVVGLRLQR